MSETSGVGLLKFHCILKAETNSNKLGTLSTIPVQNLIYVLLR